ncbi:MAG: ISL3 family transposase [Chthoniobacterales bacterium]|nr:ISL3 family transposase [Chthoniobacterales bacterium]
MIESVAIAVDGPIEVAAKPRDRRPRCGGCGRKGRRLHGVKGKARQWRHLGMWGRRVIITATVHRVLCGRCGVRTMAVPWARAGSVFTREFENEVAWMLQRTDQTAVARYFKISWRAVGRIAQRVVAESLDGSRLDGLKFIGVDEINYGRPQKFLTIVVDHVSGRTVWAAPGKSAETLGLFFAELGPERSRAIEIVTMDMSGAYTKAVHDHAPQAEIVYDRFHVVQLLNAAVDEVRREAMRMGGDDEKRSLKSARWPLLKNPWNLTLKERQKLSDLQRNNRRLYRAYLLKESFQQIYDALSVAHAEELFSEWYDWAQRSALKPFRKFAATIKSYWPAVRRFLEVRLTNAIVEGTNSKVRMISHRAFGFHSAAALISMIYLNCSNIVIPFVGW